MKKLNHNPKDNPLYEEFLIKHLEFSGYDLLQGYINAIYDKYMCFYIPEKGNVIYSKEELIDDYFRTLYELYLSKSKSKQKHGFISFVSERQRIKASKSEESDKMIKRIQDETEQLRKEVKVQQDIFTKEVAKESRKAVARKGGYGKVEKSPKSKAKQSIHNLWLDWQSGKTRHASGAAFCRFALETHKEIDSFDSVKKWIRAWRLAK